MRKLGSQVIFSPSDLNRFMESEFASWMDRYNREVGSLPPDPESPEKKVIYESGDAHEKKYLSHLQSQTPKVTVIDKDRLKFPEAHAETAKAIQSRAPVIYQAALKSASGDFQGYADFLELNGKAYTVCDTKLGRSLKPYYIIQLCAYAEMLQPLTGYLPEELAVVLAPDRSAALAGKPFQTQTLRTRDYFDYYLWLKNRFLAFHAAFKPDLKNRPEPDPRADHGCWQSYADKWIQEQDHLCQVANIHCTHIKKLNGAGISRLEQLAKLGLDKKVPKLGSEIRERLVFQAHHQLATRERREKDPAAVPSYSTLPGNILARLPDPDPGDVFFDMEGYPHYRDHTGLEYLFGAAYRDSSGKPAFKAWWAHDKNEEKQAAIEFLEWAHARLVKLPRAHIYHYATYEKTALGNLTTQHATHEKILDEILRSKRLVDLYPFVRNSFVIGEENYSLKSVEKLYRKSARSTTVAKAMDSVVQYHQWTQEGSDPSSQILKAIEDYNRDDCFSTQELFAWLHSERSKLPPPPLALPTATSATEAKATTSDDHGAPEDAFHLLLKDKPHGDLLCHLAEFHWREDKPTFWDYYRRHETPGPDLESDPTCIAQARLERPEERPKPKKGETDLSAFYPVYRFDPSQDLKLDHHDKLYFQGQPNSRPLKVLKLDEDAGRIVLGSEISPPPETSFISLNHVRSAPIPDGIRSAAEHYAANQHPLLVNLLNRSRPAGASLPSSGPLRGSTESFAQAGLRICQGMEHSVLCVQGPPGTGKTTTAAEIIADLLAQGKKVGITSNSHEAINLLAIRSGKVLQEKHSQQLSGIKQRTEKEAELHAALPGLRQSKEARLAIYAYQSTQGLACGTAWLFSRADWAGALDYLFIDEASQVSLANAVGMSRAAKNMVLLGDQNQLEQPTKGKHPDKAGFSVLNFFLDGHDTVPPEVGLFLDVSYRLHPEICSFVSHHCYESRLQPAPGNEKQTISLPKKTRWVTKPSGILFSPVEHDDGGQGSEAEADRCLQIFEELCGCTYNDKDGKKRKLTLEDFLFISPYNLQARYIRERLPKGAKVASVDKFQGKEAPVCILSLGCGGQDSGPRGLSFVLNRNRLNVAASRAQALFVMVANPALTTQATSQKEILLANPLCRLKINFFGALD
jgi:predicted RecB family nuclease